MKRFLAVILASSLLLVGGCQTNEQTGALLGASGGSLLGGLFGRNLGKSNASMMLGTLAGGAVGYFVGSSIGRSLDERDRARAQSATMTALNTPVRVSTPVQPQRPQRLPAAKRPTATWMSDKAGVKGSSTVTTIEAASDGNECRTVHEVAYIQGREVVQDTKYCRNANNEWQQATS